VLFREADQNISENEDGNEDDETLMVQYFRPVIIRFPR
jgi:hypothetical protein